MEGYGGLRGEYWGDIGEVWGGCGSDKYPKQIHRDNVYCRGLQVWSNSSQYTLPMGSSRGLGLWTVPKKYIEPMGTRGPGSVALISNTCQPELLWLLCPCLQGNEINWAFVCIFTLSSWFVCCCSVSMNDYSFLTRVFFMQNFCVSLCRCFSRSDHLALHMKRHIWEGGEKKRSGRGEEARGGRRRG